MDLHFHHSSRGCRTPCVPGWRPTVEQLLGAQGTRSTMGRRCKEECCCAQRIRWLPGRTRRSGTTEERRQHCAQRRFWPWPFAEFWWRRKPPSQLDEPCRAREAGFESGSLALRTHFSRYFRDGVGLFGFSSSTSFGYPSISCCAICVRYHGRAYGDDYLDYQAWI
jgi:hypothetical protein